MHHAGNIGAVLHKDAEEYGWQGAGADTIKHSWPALRQLTGDYIHSLNFAYGVGLRGAGVTYAEARAQFESPNSLVYTTNAGKQTRATFDRAIVSSGGRPVQLPIPGAQLAITSDDLFWLKQSPGTTLVIGGGYIALEVRREEHTGSSVERGQRSTTVHRSSSLSLSLSLCLRICLCPPQCAGFLHHLGAREGREVSVMVRGPVLRKMDQVGSTPTRTAFASAKLRRRRA